MAAQSGSITLQGASGAVYSLDMYAPDATGTRLCFNPSGLAASTSPDSYRVPEDCVIVDVAIAASPTAVGATFQRNSAVISGGTIRWADRVNTLSTRSPLAIGFKKGDFLSALQH